MRWASDLERCSSDPDAAARLLQAAIPYLRGGEPLPEALAEHIASAFEVAASKETERERVNMLGRELGLTRERVGRPAKATVEDARKLDRFDLFSDAYTSDATRAKDVSLFRRTFDCGKTKAEELYGELGKQIEEEDKARTAQAVADMEAWLTVASPAQLEAFDLTSEQLEHDEALALLRRRGLRP